MKINDASRTSGLSRDMIRHYEKLGLINPKRLSNGYRDYSDDDLYLLTVIKYLSNLGVPLKSISKAFESGQTTILEEGLISEIERLTLLETQINARIAAARDSISCFNMLSEGIPWEIYEAKERYLLSFGNHDYPEYQSAPENGDFFQFYYRQCYQIQTDVTAQGKADRGLLYYNPMPGTERIPSQQCLRAILTHPPGSLLGAPELIAPLRYAHDLTGKSYFTVLIHQIFQERRNKKAAVLCAEILLGPLESCVYQRAKP